MDHYYHALLWLKPEDRLNYVRRKTQGRILMEEPPIFPKIYRSDLAKYAVFLRESDEEPSDWCNTREEAWSLSPYKVVDVPRVEMNQKHYDQYWTEYWTEEEDETNVSYQNVEQQEDVVPQQEDITNVSYQNVDQKDVFPKEDEITPVFPQIVEPEDVVPTKDEITPVSQQSVGDEDVIPKKDEEKDLILFPEDDEDRQHVVLFPEDYEVVDNVQDDQADTLILFPESNDNELSLDTDTDPDAKETMILLSGSGSCIEDNRSLILECECGSERS